VFFSKINIIRWHDRYCLLSESKISYYEDAFSLNKSKGEYELSKLNSLVEDDHEEKRSIIMNFDGEEHPFIISAKGFTIRSLVFLIGYLVFFFIDSQVQQEWIRKISRNSPKISNPSEENFGAEEKK